MTRSRAAAVDSALDARPLTAAEREAERRRNLRETGCERPRWRDSQWGLRPVRCGRCETCAERRSWRTNRTRPSR